MPAPVAHTALLDARITEHHNAVDNVVALINLALLTGQRRPLRPAVSVPYSGQNNVQGGGDMGAIPDRLPGFQHVENDELRRKFEKVWGAKIPPKKGLAHQPHAGRHGARRADNAVLPGRESLPTPKLTRHRALKLLSGLEFMWCKTSSITKTAELADVVLPAAAGWCESEGTVTSSERRVQRVRAAVPMPPGVRDDTEIIFDLARRLGHTGANRRQNVSENELRSLSPMNAGMSYARLEEHGGMQWPCYDEQHPGEIFLHGRLWHDPLIGPARPVQRG